MRPIVRKFWPVLAVAAGGLLVYFEVRPAGGINGDNEFWVFVGGLIVILGVIDLVQPKRPPGDEGRVTELNKPLE
jgi:hypothetical protein